ncbi:MAG TPA: hypothetical protein VEZ47_04995 [Gemmatirosa sp.]|jgi:hypothetical protein|nr:hypothetical protein [Gemmatirosa sp.]
MELIMANINLRDFYERYIEALNAHEFDRMDGGRRHRRHHGRRRGPPGGERERHDCR